MHKRTDDGHVNLLLAIVILIGLSASGRTQLDTGYAAFKRGDYTAAHRIRKSLADKDNSKAQYKIGALQRGYGKSTVLQHIGRTIHHGVPQMPKENEPLMQFMSQYKPIMIFGGGFAVGFFLGIVIGLNG